jgi:hypothetical protein
MSDRTLILGKYQSILPTLVNNQVAPPALDVNGRLLVGSGGSPVIVAGAYTPADNAANPTDLVGAEAFNMAWDPVLLQWRRVQSHLLDSVGMSTTRYGLTTAALLYAKGTGGATGPLQMDDNQVLRTMVTRPSVVGASSNSPTLYRASAALSGVIKPAAGVLLSVSCDYTPAAAHWLMLFNSAALPTSGVSVPIVAFGLPNATFTRVTVGRDRHFMGPFKHGGSVHRNRRSC